jgi:hypothetical protein
MPIDSSKASACFQCHVVHFSSALPLEWILFCFFRLLSLRNELLVQPFAAEYLYCALKENIVNVNEASKNAPDHKSYPDDQGMVSGIQAPRLRVHENGVLAVTCSPESKLPRSREKTCSLYLAAWLLMTQVMR